ncbi:MAG: helix-turn-helix domain-containing protein [Eubacteriales bacterium]
MEFGEKLALLRRENRLTQSQLAASLGVTRQTVYKWESGQSYPEAMTLLAMRNLFSVSTDILLDNKLSLPEREKAAEAKKAVAANPVKETQKDEAEPETEPAVAQEESPKPKKKGFFSRLLGK